MGVEIPGEVGGTVNDIERRRVMLVDDHPMWIDALSEDLEEEGFEIVAAAKNGTECLQRARATRPDVVVMDLQIPEPDGATCTERLVREFPEIKVLVISASGERDDVLKAMKAGAKGYLVKSASKAELIEGVGWRDWCWGSSVAWPTSPATTTTRDRCSPRGRWRCCVASRRGWPTGRSPRSC